MSSDKHQAMKTELKPYQLVTWISVNELDNNP